MFHEANTDFFSFNLSNKTLFQYVISAQSTITVTKKENKIVQFTYIVNVNQNNGKSQIYNLNIARLSNNVTDSGCVCAKLTM